MKIDIISQDSETQASERARIVSEYEVKPEVLDGWAFIAKACDGFGYEEWDWYLVRSPDGTLHENEAGHCSCHGFEEQWEPKPSSVAYLLSDKFGVSGVYDEEKAEFQAWAREHLEAP